MLRKIEKSYILKLALDSLETTGLPQREANIVLAHLVDSELSGNSSHGFFRLPEIVNSLRESGAAIAPIVVENQTPVSGLVNGAGHLGLCVAEFATNVAMEIARSCGLSIVGAKNYIGTTGSMGYYNRLVTNNGLIGLILCNSSPAVSPWGGKKAILGTNPISIGVPSSEEPIIADLATAVASYGDLAIAMADGLRIPEGVVINEYGFPSRDPKDAGTGAQLPIAAHKGYSLGLMIEILAGPLVGAKAGRDTVQGSDGFLALVIDPKIFTNKDQFLSQIDSLRNEIKHSPLAPGFDEILLPGENSNRNRKARKNAEYLQIHDFVIRKMEAL